MFLRPITSLLTAALLASTVATVTASAAGAAKTPTGCSALTRSLVAADGYSSATGPVVTADNYKNVDANAANAVGTTYDFGAQALIVGCLDPAHLGAAWKAQGFSGKATNAQGFMDQLVKASSGAMTKTKVGPVTDYLDYGNGNGNGKEDGLGSLREGSQPSPRRVGRQREVRRADLLGSGRPAVTGVARLSGQLAHRAEVALLTFWPDLGTSRSCEARVTQRRVLQRRDDVVEPTNNRHPSPSTRDGRVEELSREESRSRGQRDDDLVELRTLGLVDRHRPPRLPVVQDRRWLSGSGERRSIVRAPAYAAATPSSHPRRKRRDRCRRRRDPSQCRSRSRARAFPPHWELRRAANRGRRRPDRPTTSD
jgi:hypothetical protein